MSGGVARLVALIRYARAARARPAPAAAAAAAAAPAAHLVLVAAPAAPPPSTPRPVEKRRRRAERPICVSLDPEPADVQAAIEHLAAFFVAKTIDDLRKKRRAPP
jgi:hypothetical protein